MTLNIDLEDSYRIGFIGIDDYKAGTCLAGLAHNLTRCRFFLVQKQFIHNHKESMDFLIQ